MSQADLNSSRKTSATDYLDQPVVGTWRLLSWEAHGADGVVRYPMGEDALGYVTYTADGYMTGHLMRPGRTGFASGDVLRPEPDEAVAAIGGYLAYCGTYEIVAGGVVVHHVELSLAPNWIGADQERFFELEGDRLTLSTRPLLVAGQGSQRLVWERASRGAR